jgi:hypothetical protein
MSAIPEKATGMDTIQLAERPDDAASTKESITETARLLGATPDEVLEAQEYGRTLDLAEAKKVSHHQPP